MSGEKNKLVAVIDPIWVGHHPMYFAQFVASFLRQGARVIALCPNPADARRELLEILDPAVSASISEWVIFRKITIGRRSFFNGKFEGDPIRTTLRWQRAAKLLGRIEDEIGQNIDLAYFPYLDTYLRFLPVSVAPDIILGRPWSGLYLRNHHHGYPWSPKKPLVLLAKGDAILRSDSCLGLGVLDERFIPAMERYTGKSVSLFPDFTNTSLPSEPTALAKEILAKADGRKIIGIIGLERRKGVLTMLKAAEIARKKNLPYYFVCGGKIFASEFSETEWKDLESADRSNLFLDLTAGRLPTENDFNSLFSTFDIAWAAYENFQGSSNTLGKAAAFEIPCIASEGGCIGHRVKAFHSGLTIPEGDEHRALEAVAKLAVGTDWRDQPLAPLYQEFRDQHSIRQLDKLLAELLAKL